VQTDAVEKLERALALSIAEWGQPAESDARNCAADFLFWILPRLLWLHALVIDPILHVVAILSPFF
jgi:hypothetical protein